MLHHISEQARTVSSSGFFSPWWKWLDPTKEILEVHVASHSLRLLYLHSPVVIVCYPSCISIWV